MRQIFQVLSQWVVELCRSIGGAVVFYTCIPLPAGYSNLQRIARWAPLVGCLIGGLLFLLDLLLTSLRIPQLTRSAIAIAAWAKITGGLHLDGLIDTADGLAVGEPQRRLEVMRDSVTGAFGVIAAVVLLIVKTAALSEITNLRWWALISAATWARWGQVCAIAFYPYLRPTGKGAFHRTNFLFPQDLVVGWILAIALCLLLLPFDYSLGWTIANVLVGTGLALFVPWWINQKFGGHTGDTYGAVVEVRLVG